MLEGRDEYLDAVDHACFQIMHMAKANDAESVHPALHWRLSEEAKEEIRQIELNYMTALHRIGHLQVG